MKQIGLLTSRNLRLFFRDRAGVFFSLLSPLILLGIYTLFLGNLQVESLKDGFPNASDKDINYFVTTWVFAGITMITTLTTALAAMNVYVEDVASGRFKDFIVSPLKRHQVVSGYIFASFVVSIVMTALVVVVGQLYMLTQGYPLFGLEQILQLLGYVALSSAAFAAIAGFITSFVSSTGAFSAVSTIVGTIIGFLAGAYIPVGSFPDVAANTVNSLPFAHSALLIREPYVSDSLEKLSGGAPQVKEAIEPVYGITAQVGTFDITSSIAMVSLGLVFVVFLAFGVWRMAKRIR